MLLIWSEKETKCSVEPFKDFCECLTMPKGWETVDLEANHLQTQFSSQNTLKFKTEVKQKAKNSSDGFLFFVSDQQHVKSKVIQVFIYDITMRKIILTSTAFFGDLEPLYS